MHDEHLVRKRRFLTKSRLARGLHFSVFSIEIIIKVVVFQEAFSWFRFADARIG